jgi:hypothetical protein
MPPMGNNGNANAMSLFHTDSHIEENKWNTDLAVAAQSDPALLIQQSPLLEKGQSSNVHSSGTLKVSSEGGFLLDGNVKGKKKGKNLRVSL